MSALFKYRNRNLLPLPASLLDKCYHALTNTMLTLFSPQSSDASDLPSCHSWHALFWGGAFKHGIRIHGPQNAVKRARPLMLHLMIFIECATAAATEQEF
jgi:hypothetical protein